jgi:ABC-type lipoprotein export system ATPase subunit
MLTKLIVRNFKQFKEVEIELGNPVVFIGPNNSGKTTALQALALWDTGLKSWMAKRKKAHSTGKRTGVTINRRDLLALPIPDANLLWRDLHVRDVRRIDGKQATQNIRMDIIVEGVTKEKFWKCGLEFDYANNESIYCRPLLVSDNVESERMPIPDETGSIKFAYLPPMSGLAAQETRLDPGAINVRLGEGRTAEVLRNLCYMVYLDTQKNQDAEKWNVLCSRIKDLFGVTLEEPVYISERGEITMTYRTPSGTRLDLSSSGRGLQQTLLLLAYLSANSDSVVLLDEPDAHLEILRQRQIYEILSESARNNDSQIIAASHSEIILNEAADRDVVVAFVGTPHRIDDRGSQLLKSLKEVGFEQYYQAEQKGWVLYLEGSTDLSMLRTFAKLLKHPVLAHLEQPFVHYILNQPQKAREHFYDLKEAYKELRGFVLCDRIEKKLQEQDELKEYMWKRRELENYLAFPDVLCAYADDMAKKDVTWSFFEDSDTKKNRDIMMECIEDFAPRAALRDLTDKWWIDTKMSDDFLDRLFEKFFKRLGMPNIMRKTDYHVLVQYVPERLIDPEINNVLDAVLETASSAKSLREGENI